MNKKVIFCAGISVRSGTNFIGSIFSEIESVDSLPKNTTKGEFPFFSNKTFNHYKSWVKGFQSTFFAIPNIDEKRLSPYFADGFLNYLTKEYDLQNEYLFFKNPSLYNVQYFYDFFPEGKLLIITRSAPDLIASSLKASSLIRKSKSKLQNLKSKVKLYSGYNMYVFSKAYVKHTEQLLKIRNDFKDKFIEVKYEDIIANPKDEIKEILDYCEIVYSEIEFQNAVNAKVVGSSFFGSNQHIQNWGKLNKTEDFNSVGRYKSWNWFNKLVFNIVASKSNNLAGYNHKL